MSEVRTVSLTDMNPAPYNPRTISDDAFEGLGASMERFGLLSLIIWNERTNNIVGGHQRYKKLVEEGVQTADVVVVDLNDDDEIALNIALNSPQLRGEFTRDVLELLRLSEVQIGSAFNDVKLNDLYSYLKKRKFEGDPPKKKDKQQDVSPADGPEGSSMIDHSPPIDDEPDAVVVCPKCSSVWRMSDNKVIYNAKEEPISVESEDGQAG